MSALQEINGHPALDAEPIFAKNQRRANRITLCAECNSMRSILFFVGDRWFCTKCRNSGSAKSTTQIAFNSRRY